MTNQQKRNLALTTLFTLIALTLITLAAVLPRRHTTLTRGIPPLTADPIPNHNGPTLGLNVDLTQYNDSQLQQTLQQIADLHITHIKQPFYHTPDFDWDEAQRLITAVNQHPTLTLTPLLDGDPATSFAPPESIESYAQWAADFATRFGPHIDHYIIWDEPNITTHWGGGDINPDRYGALLTAASHAIKTADPHALIVLAPLAPTIEESRVNLADDLYLQALYDNGSAPAFDIVSAKPYGFDLPPTNRDIGRDTFNLSRAILLREVMTSNGDQQKPLWAANWGWNQQENSPWGTVSPQNQIRYTLQGFQRAQQEWPWLGHMYIQHWEPADPTRAGFALNNHPDLNQLTTLTSDPINPAAQPGFHFATPSDPNQTYSGNWEFSPQFGADVSQKLDNEPPDTVTFTFEGTDVGIRVRRANYRARFYILIDGQPANALPPDETTNTPHGRGSALVLNTNDPDLDTIETILVGRNLTPGRHTLTLTTHRGWDQFALNGFAVSHQPPNTLPRDLTLLLSGALFFFLMAWSRGRHLSWQQLPLLPTLIHWHSQASIQAQLLLTTAAGLLVALSGWLTWGQQAAGLYRRWPDTTQLTLTLGTALIFYITPWFPLYIAALILLYLLLTQRPTWGLALTILSFPFYVTDTLKPIYHYRFSAVEIFTLITLAATLTHLLFRCAHNRHTQTPHPPFKFHRLHKADYAALAFTAVATLSLFFTTHLNVATNEWRVIIIEPLLFYITYRLLRPTKQEFYILIAAFIASGLLVALIGLTNYTLGHNLITAEGGLMRLRAHYGSPNNVALYLGRILPIPLALLLFSTKKPVAGLPTEPPTRRTNTIRQSSIVNHQSSIALLAFLMLATILLTFSKGSLFLALPLTFIFLFIMWQKSNGRTSWPWLISAALLAALGYTALLQIPALAPRLDLTGATSDFRLNLWQSSLNMWRDHPLIGVGLDNFLYEYRGRYILSTAWQEPSLNHPHQILLDFATRLGLLGLLAGTALFTSLISTLTSLLPSRNPLVIGLLGTAVYTLAHGLVDHSFFLIDLAYVFYFVLGSVVWLHTSADNSQ